MTKAIGPNFANELSAAGLLGLPFTWGDDGTLNLSHLTQQQSTSVNAVYAAHSPETPNAQQQIAAGLAQLATALAPGVEVTFSSNSDLTGTYAVNDAQRAFITGIVTGINARNGRVPGGGSTFIYTDINGQTKNFTAAEFLSFAQELEDYVYNLSNGLPQTLPLVVA